MLCMESSVDDNIIFAGGSSNYEITKGQAKIFALTFDHNIDFIAELILPNNIVNTMAVSDLKRMPNIDVLFCGTNSAVYVIEWTGSHFEILIQVDEVHSCTLLKQFNFFLIIL